MRAQHCDYLEHWKNNKTVINDYRFTKCFSSPYVFCVQNRPFWICAWRLNSNIFWIHCIKQLLTSVSFQFNRLLFGSNCFFTNIKFHILHFCGQTLTHLGHANGYQCISVIFFNARLWQNQFYTRIVGDNAWNKKKSLKVLICNLY